MDELRSAAAKFRDARVEHASPDPSHIEAAQRSARRTTGPLR
jgi:hypothetical protein